MLNSREGVRVWAVSQKTCRICRKVVHDASWIGHERQTNITGKECLHSSWRDAMGIYFNYINKRMKKIFTSIVLALCISVSVLAQTTTINVQGQQRKVSATVAARIQKAAEAVTSTGIDFSKIERWAGEGDCKAALAIKWADGQNDGKTLVWGYRWKSSEHKTGEDMIRAVAKADPALYFIGSEGAYGFSIGGFGYDTDGNRYVTVTTPEVEAYPRNGFVEVGTGSYDDCAATDIDHDAWNSGWYTGYWSYYVADKAEEALGYSGTGASGRVLNDGCVDAFVFGYFSGSNKNEYDGNLEYLPATTDYTKGAFIVNEDWFAHNNSTVNYLTRDGKFVYNNTTEIGATACFGAAWGNRYYIIAKQAKDGGAKVEGGRITICDANTMRIIKQIKDINGNEDGRSFCGVDEHKAYVSTSRGIYTLNLDELTVGAAVKNADGGDAELGECGNMVRLGDYVYATEYGKSLRIIDCNTDRIVATISSAKVYSITMSKDGQLWVSTDKGISRVNTETNKLETISLPEGINVPANSYGVWCPDGLCASMQNNVIYWTSVSWNILKVFKYDIDNNEFAKVVDLTNDADKWKMYSASNLRVDPVTDNLYVSLYKDFGSQDYAVRIYDNNGNQLNEYELTQKNCWFPGMFVFPDVEDPIAGNIDAVTVEENKEVKVDLATVCSDADNFQAAIIKTIKDVSKENIATATVKDGKLIVKGLKEGSTVVTLNFCSNGISTTTTVRFFVTKATGITDTQTSADVREIARFTIDGKRINQPQRGINIVKYSDGTVKKVVVK